MGRVAPNIKKKRCLVTFQRAEGQASVEFILSIMVFVFLFMWSWELVMLTYTYSVLADSAKEGVRYAIVHGSGNSDCSGPGCADSTGSNVTSVVRTYARDCFHDISGMTVTVTYPDKSSAAPGRVRVVVRYAYRSYFSLAWSLPTINAAAEGRILN